MLSIWIKNSLIIDSKQKLRAYKISYAYNIQYDGSTMFFVIVKMVHPDTRAGSSDIKTNKETMNLS